MVFLFWLPNRLLRLFVWREANGAADPYAYCMRRHRLPHLSQGKGYGGIIGKFIKEGRAMEKKY
jgi:hypothetical protein